MMAESAGLLVEKGVAPELELFPEMTELEVRTIAWRNCGLVRNQAGLEAALSKLAVSMKPRSAPTRFGYELRNIDLVASLIARAALARRESRGGHYRTDFPERVEEFEKHSEQTKGSGAVLFS